MPAASSSAGTTISVLPVRTVWYHSPRVRRIIAGLSTFLVGFGLGIAITLLVIL